MKNKFNQIMAEVERKYNVLIKSSPFTWNTVPKKYDQGAGIYLFSENDKPFYVGRTNNLKRRLRNHTRPSHNMATFAFLLARHATEWLSASYRPSGSRKDLLKNDKTFRKAFDEARERIKRMDVQFVEEKEPVGQALLEIYAAYVSKAKYNSSADILGLQPEAECRPKRSEGIFAQPSAGQRSETPGFSPGSGFI